MTIGYGASRPVAPTRILTVPTTRLGGSATGGLKLCCRSAEWLNGSVGAWKVLGLSPFVRNQPNSY
jgi:hypothetical protein